MLLRVGRPDIANITVATHICKTFGLYHATTTHTKLQSPTFSTTSNTLSRTTSSTSSKSRSRSGLVSLDGLDGSALVGSKSARVLKELQIHFYRRAVLKSSGVFVFQMTLSRDEMATVRHRAKKLGGRAFFVDNHLIRFALKDTPYRILSPMFHSNCALIVIPNTTVASDAARILIETSNANKQLNTTGTACSRLIPLCGTLRNLIFELPDIIALAHCKTVKFHRKQLVKTLHSQGPTAQIINAAALPIHSFLNLLHARLLNLRANISLSDTPQSTTLD